ncbi:MAG: hypothetical protein V3S14_03550 [Anaerolineae bacterium]
MISSTTLTLTDKDTHDAVVERLATYLPLEASGYECTTEMVLDVLIKAAATQQTIECVCNDLDGMVSGETIRGYLNEQIKVDDLYDLEQRVNQALVAELPRRLWKTKLQVAIDLHDEPFYGHSAELLDFTCLPVGRQVAGQLKRVPPVSSAWQLLMSYSKTCVSP